MKVVFVCTGNTCRSPMAEGIFRTLIKNKGLTDIECTSCGLSAFCGSPASEYAIAAAKKYGADISSHSSRSASRYLLDEGDLFVCMTREHKDILSSFVPDEKLVVLSKDGIPDPYMGTFEDYLLCAEKIHNALSELIETRGVFE